ncbi:hypothetical protein G6O69_09250 [Pseudenhygromyxa sp. WMMC2535]|uniref:hypothetical protein n=1 Tax=Pseudenhygromyxa sp. WMMC2535 TaxID=2712867 RepID=UPI001553DAD5|nr:hypothetical protein [Pseudenhygromyxa sp. WMMC2535]NVB38017.1 hypothetical protein [Pseudenhygromyxa sp. WMMC2535]
MKRVRFIVTGDLERLAIVESVSRHYKGLTHEGHEVEWLPPRKVHAATSARLQPEQGPGKAMLGLARALVAEAIEGADGTPADLAIALDDVELHNFGREAVICAHFRRAIEAELKRRSMSASHEARVRAQLQGRCSFHLLRPMVESYLFGDPGALRRAGCAASVQPQLVDPDVESFEANDPSWTPRCNATDANMAGRYPWWRERRHPKHYLEHLVERSGGFYDECVHGAPAFSQLSWRNVASQPTWVPCIRALFEDIADFFGRPQSPLGSGTPSGLTYPARSVVRAGLTLRNL